MKIIPLAGAVVCGLLITYVDTRPTWDDTGIIVLALVLASGFVGLFIDKKPWLYALAIGIWLPLWYILTTRDIRMIIPLGISFLGVYAGYAVRRMLRSVHQAG